MTRILPILFALTGIISAAFVLWSPTWEQFYNVKNSLQQIWQNDATPTCSKQDYSVEILSLDPLTIYINNFLTPRETEYLVQTSLNHTNYHGRRSNGDKLPDASSPKSYLLPKSNPITTCVGQRALSFLGFLEHTDFEEPWIVVYQPNQKFGLHVESAEAPYTEGDDPTPFNRLSTFFIYLETDCDGGETYYPKLNPPPGDANDTKFAKTASGKGLAIRPIRGNAVFWLNNHRNGSVHESTMHMGLPITRGRKIGMNIFTKEKWRGEISH